VELYGVMFFRNFWLGYRENDYGEKFLIQR
jgi:hypothetical protein